MLDGRLFALVDYLLDVRWLCSPVNFQSHFQGAGVFSNSLRCCIIDITFLDTFLCFSYYSRDLHALSLNPRNDPMRLVLLTSDFKFGGTQRGEGSCPRSIRKFDS